MTSSRYAAFKEQTDQLAALGTPLVSIQNELDSSVGALAEDLRIWGGVPPESGDRVAIGLILDALITGASAGGTGALNDDSFKKAFKVVTSAAETAEGDTHVWAAVLRDDGWPVAAGDDTIAQALRIGGSLVGPVLEEFVAPDQRSEAMGHIALNLAITSLSAFLAVNR